MKNDIELELSNLAPELYRVGYTHQSDLYSLLKCMGVGKKLDFSGKIYCIVNLAIKLEKISTLEEVEMRIEEMYDYYHIDLKEKSGYIRIYDDFEDLIYTCRTSILNLNDSMSNHEQVEVIRSHLVEQKIIRKIDILAL